MARHERNPPHVTQKSFERTPANYSNFTCTRSKARAIAIELPSCTLPILVRVASTIAATRLHEHLSLAGFA